MTTPGGFIQRAACHSARYLLAAQHTLPPHTLRLEAFAKSVPGAVEKYPQVSDGHLENLTDLFALEFLHLAEDEDHALLGG